jgi:3-oxoadipate enol-lactonase
MEKERCFSAHFVGVSMGSLLAQHFGFIYPEKVISLTSVGGYYIHANNTEIIRAQRSEQLTWIWKALLSMDLFRKHVAKVSVYKPEQQAFFYEMAKQFTRKSFLLMQGLEDILERIEEEEIPYPMLMICGEHDIELAKKANQEWHNLFPKSSYIEIENAGHCANMDNPDAWNKIVLEFIQKQ